jgi:hypothetical protein
MRRRSSKSEAEVYFQVLEWLAEVRRGWGSIYSPHRFLTVGVSEHRIYVVWLHDFVTALADLDCNTLLDEKLAKLRQLVTAPVQTLAKPSPESFPSHPH